MLAEWHLDENGHFGGLKMKTTEVHCMLFNCFRSTDKSFFQSTITFILRLPWSHHFHPFLFLATRTPSFAWVLNRFHFIAPWHDKEWHAGAIWGATAPWINMAENTDSTTTAVTVTAWFRGFEIFMVTEVYWRGKVEVMLKRSLPAIWRNQSWYWQRKSWTFIPCFFRTSQKTRSAILLAEMCGEMVPIWEFEEPCWIFFPVTKRETYPHACVLQFENADVLPSYFTEAGAKSYKRTILWDSHCCNVCFLLEKILIGAQRFLERILEDNTFWIIFGRYIWKVRLNVYFK